MSVFDSLVVRMDQTVDRIYAEDFSFAPMVTTPNSRPQPDASRAKVASLQAAFLDAGELLKVGESGGPDRSSSQPMISVVDSLLPQGVRQGDRFTRLKTGKVYEVTRTDPDGVNRSLLTVVERKP